MLRKIARFILFIVTAVIVVCGVVHCYRRFIAESPDIIPDFSFYSKRGIDISSHNGDIDFRRVRADGIDFVIIKATEGTDFKDRCFVSNFTAARKAGLKVGAYHFFRFDTDGTLQAINFLHSLRGRHLDMPAIIDVEEWGNPDGNATSLIVNRLRHMIDRLEYFGYSVILYTNRDSYLRFIKGNFDDYPLWYCSVIEPEDNIAWDIWQYSHSGHVDGIRGNVDLNTVRPDFTLIPTPSTLTVSQ